MKGYMGQELDHIKALLLQELGRGFWRKAIGIYLPSIHLYWGLQG